MIKPKFINQVVQKLQTNNIYYQLDFKLSKLSQFKIGGFVPLIIYPDDEDKVLNTLEILNRFGIKYKILGGGTNLLISDTLKDFVVVHLSGIFKEFKQINSNSFFIGSSANTTSTFRKISKMGYTGAEFLTTIPGWVGGAVCQNAGCYGIEFFEIIQKVQFIEDFQILNKCKSQIFFSYRNSDFLSDKDKMILGVQIQLQKGDMQEIELRLKENLKQRKFSQPKNRKSAGSIFKNPKNQKAWKLIDEVGLRGFSKGDALISEEHCNFILNQGKAAASDVFYLIQMIQEKVYHKRNILLDREVEIWGNII